MPKFMGGHRHEVESIPWDWQRDSPGLGFVEMGITGKIAAIGRWIERVGQNPSDAIERGTVAVVARDEPNHDLGVLMHRHLAESEGSHITPQGKRCTDGVSSLRLGKIGTEILEPVP